MPKKDNEELLLLYQASNTRIEKKSLQKPSTPMRETTGSGNVVSVIMDYPLTWFNDGIQQEKPLDLQTYKPKKT